MSFDKHNERILEGSCVSYGSAKGVIYIKKETQSRKTVKTVLLANEISEEIDRYNKALDASKSELLSLHASLKYQKADDAADIIDSHIQMLGDPFLTVMMDERIRGQMSSSESVFTEAVEEYQQQLLAIGDSFFSQRVTDIRDISERVLRNLRSESGDILYACEPVIVVVRELTPSIAAQASHHVVGFITECGGYLSHAAMIARAKNIPVLSNVDYDMIIDYEGVDCVLDGKNGTATFSPSIEKLRSFRQNANRDFAHPSPEEDLVTKDGMSVTLLANIGQLHELTSSAFLHAKGVGLFRSEYIFLEEYSFDAMLMLQQMYYEKLLDRCQSNDVTIRLFDFGSDKPYFEDAGLQLDTQKERSIRLLLKNPTILQGQIKAILLAAKDRVFNLLIPMVTDVSEVTQVKSVVEKVSKELNVSHSAKIGAMIESPAAVFIIPALARVCDYLSLGTNDLLQYCLAIERKDGEIAEKMWMYHPGFLAIVHKAVEFALQENITLTICGESAADPLLVGFFLGMSQTRLSMTPKAIPKVSRVVQALDTQLCQMLVKTVLSKSSSLEVKKTLEQFLEAVERNPDSV